MWRLVPALVRQMGAAYPELGRAEALIAETLKLEETGFRETLARGLKLLDEEEGNLPKGKEFPGEVAFKLYDTFGFPLDLTEDVLRGRGRKVATKAFDQAMERQRAEARKSWVGSGEAATGPVWFELREKLGATEFLGYEATEAEGAIQAIVDRRQERARGQGRLIGRHRRQPDAVLRRIRRPDGRHRRDVFIARAANSRSPTRRNAPANCTSHLGKVAHGVLKVGDVVELRIDDARRDALRANHSVTHLLHQALRRRLGAHVTQKGSLVAPDRLRFDFSHPRALTPEDLAAVETRGECPHPPERRGFDPADDARPRGRAGGAGPVRREIRRRGARRRHGR